MLHWTLITLYGVQMLNGPPKMVNAPKEDARCITEHEHTTIRKLCLRGMFYEIEGWDLGRLTPKTFHGHRTGS